jgi:beta-lactamase class D
VKKLTTLMGALFVASLSGTVSAESTSTSEKLCLQGSNDCTFVLFSEQQDQSNPVFTMINEQRARTPFSPFSTFKVANSLIALDVGVVSDSQQILTFNKENYPVQAWWPPVWKLPSYNLTTAFKYSMVAIYRQMATNIGQSQMENYVSKFTYGNKDISSGLDNFWLEGSLQISAK